MMPQAACYANPRDMRKGRDGEGWWGGVWRTERGSRGALQGILLVEGQIGGVSMWRREWTCGCEGVTEAPQV